MTNERTRFGAIHILSWIALVIGIVYFTFRGPIVTTGGRLWDYAVYASSSHEWAHGRDPYDQGAVNASWTSRSPGYGIERELSRWQAIAPPWTLAALSPFAVLPIAIGSYAYLAASMALNSWAAVCCARWEKLNGCTSRRWLFAALLVSVPVTLGLYSGNPIVLAAPLILLGLHASSNGRTTLGGIALGLGTALKFQIGIPMLAFWLVSGRWRAASIGAATFAAIALIGLGRPIASGVDVVHGWLANVASANGPGGVNDFAVSGNPDDYLNLQMPLWLLTHDRTIANAGAAVLWLVPAVPFAWWLLRLRRPEGVVLLAAVGAAATLCMIPVYHRAYDGLMFLPILALALALIAGGRQTRWIGWLAVVLLAPLAIPSSLASVVERRHYLPAALLDTVVWRGLIVPLKAWSTYGLSLLMVFACRRLSNADSDGVVAENPLKNQISTSPAA